MELTMLELIPTTAFVAVMATAAVTDLRSHKIPNRLVVAGLVIGLATRALLGWAALGSGILAAAAALFLGVILFSLGAMGAGDGKLMAVVGAFMGLENGMLALLSAAVVGGVLSLALAARRGVVLPVLLNTRDLGVWLLTFGRRGERVKLDSPGAVAFPFGVAIAIGSLAVWFGLVSL
jgi:prepilin peptidase CpaA